MNTISQRERKGGGDVYMYDKRDGGRHIELETKERQMEIKQ